jgi:hypothetical protein
MPVILALGRLKQKDHMFEARVDYIVISCQRKKRKEGRGGRRKKGGGRKRRKKRGRKKGRKEGKQKGRKLEKSLLSCCRGSMFFLYV